MATVDNTRYYIEWTSNYTAKHRPRVAWTKYSGPYSSLRRVMQAKKDILSSPYCGDWLYRIAHYHKGR